MEREAGVQVCGNHLGEDGDEDGEEDGEEQEEVGVGLGEDVEA